jgi:hypothetical protein
MIHVGDEPVELGEREPGVLGGPADGGAGELELALRGSSVLVVLRLSDSDDDGLAMHERA